MARPDDVVQKEIDDEKRKLGIGDKAAESKDEDESKDESETKDKSQEETEEEDDKKSETEDDSKVEDDGDKNADDSKKDDKTDLSHSRRKSPVKEVKDEYKGIIDQKDKDIAELKGKLEKYETETKGDKPNEEKLSDLADDIKAAAEKLGLKPDALAEIVNLARKGLEIPKDKLAFIDKANQEAADRQEVEHFKGEWGDLLPAIKEQYPTATQEQLDKAFAEMEKLARHTSEEYAKYELPYILFKHQQDFAKILFTPKKKGGESSASRSADEQSDDSEYKALDPKVGLSPREVARKERQMKALANKDKEPLKIVDSESGEERFE